MLYFFATLSTICRLCTGNVNSLRGFTDGLNSLIYAVVTDWSAIDEVIRFAEKNDLKVSVLLGISKVASDYRIRYFPTYDLMDAEKQVFHRTVGYSIALGMHWNLAGARHPDFGFHFLNFLFQ